MKKYRAIFKITWQNNLEYRVEFLAHMVRGLIYLAVLIFIWKAVFTQIPNFGGYTFPSMLTYLVMAKFLHFANRGNITRLVGWEIKEGRLSLYLLKPIDYLKVWFSYFWAERVFEAMIRISIFVAFLLFLPNFFKFPPLGRMAVFLVFLPFSLIFNFLFNFILASLTFWVTDTRLFRTAVGLVTGFLAGELIPIDIMPVFLKEWGLLLPFQYTLYFPIKIYQGSLSNGEILRGGLFLVFWLGIFYFSLNYLWQKGLKRYEAIGQ